MNNIYGSEEVESEPKPLDDKLPIWGSVAAIVGIITMFIPTLVLFSPIALMTAIIIFGFAPLPKWLSIIAIIVFSLFLVASVLLIVVLLVIVFVHFGVFS